MNNAMSLPIALTDDMKAAIIERSATLVAKASAPKALLSLRDIEALTGFAYNGHTMNQMVKDKDFPRAVLVGTRERRWFSGEVFRWLERRRDL